MFTSAQRVLSVSLTPVHRIYKCHADRPDFFFLYHCAGQANAGSGMPLSRTCQPVSRSAVIVT